MEALVSRNIYTKYCIAVRLPALPLQLQYNKMVQIVYVFEKVSLFRAFWVESLRIFSDSTVCLFLPMQFLSSLSQPICCRTIFLMFQERVSSIQAAKATDKAKSRNQRQVQIQRKTKTEEILEHLLTNGDADIQNSI